MWWMIFPVVIIGLMFYINKLHKRLKNVNGDKPLWMDITDIAVNKTLDNGSIKAFVTLKVGDTFVLKDMRILSDKDSGDGGLRIEVPVRVTKKGHMMDVYQFIDKDYKKRLFDTILRKYRNL